MAYRQEACLLRNCCVALRYLHFADHTFQGPLIHQHHYPESHRLVSRVAPLCNGVSFKSTGLLFSWVCSSPILQVILRRTFAVRSLQVQLSVQPLAGRSNP